jgi:hypothetical protein
MGPESEDPPDPGIDLQIIQLGGEGAVGTARPRIQPHCHLLLPEWLNAMTYEGPRPSTRLVVAIGQCRIGVIFCGCIVEPRHTPNWAEGRGSHP